MFAKDQGTGIALAGHLVGEPALEGKRSLEVDRAKEKDPQAWLDIR